MDWVSHYHGHNVETLKLIIAKARKLNKPIIYLIGDSSLDNKFWFIKNNSSMVKPNSFYSEFINETVPDIEFCLNDIIDNKFVVINCAVEESTLEQRMNKLTEQDILVQTTIRNDDVVICSVGGNDIALKPKPMTMFAMASLLFLSDTKSLSTCTAIGFDTIRTIFYSNMKSYLEKVVKAKAHVILCTMYYPHENNTIESWANSSLNLMGYNSNKNKIHSIIKSIHNNMISKIKINNAKTMNYIPLYEVLDSAFESEDYLFRVEPSHKGGIKIANSINSLLNNLMVLP